MDALDCEERHDIYNHAKKGGLQVQAEVGSLCKWKLGINRLNTECSLFLRWKHFNQKKPPPPHLTLYILIERQDQIHAQLPSPAPARIERLQGKHAASIDLLWPEQLRGFHCQTRQCCQCQLRGVMKSLVKPGQHLPEKEPFFWTQMLTIEGGLMKS